MLGCCECYCLNNDYEELFPVEAKQFSLPAPLPQWPQGRGFATVIIIGVFDNCHFQGGDKSGGAKDSRIGKTDEKKQAATDVLFYYSKFFMACIGNQVRPCDLRLHLVKEVSGIPTKIKKDSARVGTSPDAMGESSSSGTSRLDKTESFRAL